MKAKGYQSGFSRLHPETTYDIQSRERKARTVLAVLKDCLGDRLSDRCVLDTGASTGIIANFLAAHCGLVTGIDIDRDAIAFARRTFNGENLRFQLGDSMDIPFGAGVFDVVICTHVYEHVPSAHRLLQEIQRVLKPKGWCYFAAGNRLNIIEPHYSLPFLSWLPHLLAHRYLRLTGRGDFYYEKHLSLSGLRRLTAAFRCRDYTRRIITAPETYHAGYMLRPGSAKARIAPVIARWAYWLVPTYIWMLQKRR